MTESPRNRPGRVTWGGAPQRLAQVTDGRPWLRGTHGNVGRIPYHIGQCLLGREFANFDAFRQAFWQAVGNDPILSAQFSAANVALMKTGAAPRASSTQGFSTGLRERQRSRPEVNPNPPLASEATGFVMLSHSRVGDPYHLHHMQPIHAGGDVYALSNLIVVTARYHQEVLDPDYHYKR